MAALWAWPFHPWDSSHQQGCNGCPMSRVGCYPRAASNAWRMAGISTRKRDRGFVTSRNDQTRHKSQTAFAMMAQLTNGTQMSKTRIASGLEHLEIPITICALSPPYRYCGLINGAGSSKSWDCPSQLVWISLTQLCSISHSLWCFSSASSGRTKDRIHLQ